MEHLTLYGFGEFLLVLFAGMLINCLFIIRFIEGVRRKAVSARAAWIHLALLVSWCCLVVFDPTFFAFGIWCIAPLHLFVAFLVAEWKMALQKSSQKTNV